jgi:hypothetical protein
MVGQSQENSRNVILGKVAGSRSEAATQSKDPYTLTGTSEIRKALS